MKGTCKLSVEDWTLLIIIVTLFFPYIPLGSSRIVSDFLLTIITIPVAVILLLKKNTNKNMFVCFFSLFILHLISTIYGYCVLGVSIHESDFFVLMSDIKYLCLIILASSCRFCPFFKKNHNFLLLGTVFIVVICIVEYLNIANIAWKLGKYYSSDLHTYYMVNNGRRIVATGSDPNVGAVIISFFCLYNLIYYQLYKKYIHLCYAILLYACVILTSSRTVFFGLSFCILIKILSDSGIKFKVKVGIILLLVFMVLLLLPYFSYLINGFQSFVSDEGNSSFNSRLFLWESMMELINKSIYLGWGPAESIIDGYPIDGEYIYLLFRYGLVGLFLYIIINVSLLKSLSNSNSKITLNEKLYIDYVKSIFLLSLFVMITNNFYSGKQLFHLYIVILSVVYQEIKNKKNYENDISYPAEN